MKVKEVSGERGLRRPDSVPSDDTGRQCSSQLPRGGAMSAGPGETEGARGESGPESASSLPYGAGQADLRRF